MKSLKIDFVYLLNAPFTFKTNKPVDKIKNYLNWVVDKLQADALMISSYPLMQYVRKIYPDIPIYISTIAGIKTAEQLEQYRNISPSRLVVHHDVNRNFDDLSELVQKARDWGIDVELMATESCLRGCPNRETHYKYLGEGNIDKPFHTTCNRQKITYPREFIKANIIRPEDMSFYNAMGINLFKITGRSKPAAWLPEVTSAYLKRKYSKNLIRLLGIDPTLKAEEWIYINNQAMDGFLEGFPRTGIEQEENLYCDKWISKLYAEENFRVNDGTKYEIDSSGFLRCKLFGKRASSLVS